MKCLPAIHEARINTHAIQTQVMNNHEVPNEY